MMAVKITLMMPVNPAICAQRKVAFVVSVPRGSASPLCRRE